MATRKRDRVKRTVLLLVALCVLAFLLELNRWLPGTWPGGGGGGIKTAGDLVKTPDTDKPEDDTGAVAPPKEPPANWPPPEGIVVEVRGPNGSLETEWRLGTGGGGEEKPDAAGRLRTGNARARERGFRIGTKGGKLRHEHGVNAHVAAWSIHLPAAKLPTQRDGGRAGLRIIDAVTKTPIQGARVEWQARGRMQRAESDATGEVVVKPEYGGRAARVTIHADGYETHKAWASPRDTRLREVALEKIVRKPARFLYNGEPVSAGFTLFDGGGRRLRIPQGKDEVRVPESQVESAWVEIRATGMVFRMRVRDLKDEMTVPDGKLIDVDLKDVNGAALSSARIFAEVPVANEGGPDRFEGGARNQALGSDRRLTVPEGRAFKLIVEAPGKAPIVRGFTAVDGNAPLEFVAEDGIMVPVRVAGEGKPLPGARVVARASVQGVRIVRSAQTGRDGRANVGPFGRGPVEIFVTAAGRAWSANVAEAGPAMGTVEMKLEAGFPVHLVVEDPYGVPLRGVDVEVTPVKGPPLVSPPPPVKSRTNVGGRLTIEHIPNGLYSVRLTLDGHHTEVLRSVQPGAVTYFATLVPK